MDVFDVTRNGLRCGTVEVTTAGLMTEFSFTGAGPDAQIYRLAAFCADAPATLGVAMPDSSGRLRFRKSFSKNALRELGFSQPATFELLLTEELGKPRRELHDASVSDTMRRAQDLMAASKAADAPVAAAEHEDTTEVFAPTPLPAQNSDPTEPEPLFTRPETRGAETMRRAQELLTAKQAEDADKTAANTDNDSFDGAAAQGYAPISDAAGLFAEPDIYCEGTIEGALVKVEGSVTHLAVPMRVDTPFPLLSIFCFGEPIRMGETDYLVFRLREGVVTAQAM